MKRWYQSKTIWYNIAMTCVAVGNELLPIVEVLSPEEAADVRILLVILLSLGNTLLRVVTATKVTL